MNNSDQARLDYAPALPLPWGGTDAQAQSKLQVIQSNGQRSPTTWRTNWNQPLVPPATQPAAP